MKDDLLKRDTAPQNDDSLDDDSVQFIAMAASRSRDTLLSGIAALRNMEPNLPPTEQLQAQEMIEKLGHLILAWDELLRQTDNILTRAHPDTPREHLAN